MRFIINTNDLTAAIATVNKALPSRSTLPALEGIYAELEGNTLLLRCNDLSLQIETQISCSGFEDGATVFPGKLFSEFARRFPGEETSIEVLESTATIESGFFKTTLQTLNPNDVHKMLSISDGERISLKADVMRSMVRQTIFAASIDDSKPILMGALLTQSENELSLVALDGFRLAIRTEKILNATGEKKAVIPARSLAEISKILPDADESFEMVFSRTHLMIDIGETRITTRLMDGEFLKYKQLLPNTHKTRARINRTELMRGIDRVALMAREGKSNLIKLSLSNSGIILSSNSELGRCNEHLDFEVMGEGLDIAFNANYILDVLKVLDEEDVYMDFNSNISPSVIRPINTDEFFYLILPVRLFQN